MEKTHWLQNQNKNYLGHFDLPNGEDIIFTIGKAGWESVENPKTKSTSEKRVVHFQENFKWIKPFICNETNAKMIFKMTGQSFMEDCIGKKIKIGIDKTKLMGNEVDCLRVRQIKSSALEDDFISLDQANELKNIAAGVSFDIQKVCQAFKIDDISKLGAKNFEKVKKVLLDKRDANN